MKSEENIIIILTILVGISYCVNCWNFRVYNKSFDDFVVVPKDYANHILNNTYYNSSKEMVIFTYGINGKPVGDSVRTVITAYLAPRKANPILLNWQEEAVTSSALSYINVSSNAKIIGKELGEIIIQLQNAGLDLDTIHLLGFSLGCIVMKNAALKVQEYGKNITRFTCMDPAGALFEGPFKEQGVMASDAKMVVIVHTNPGMLGTYESQATVDLWVNCASSIQPGCENSTKTVQFATPEAFCSHKRSFAYFAEAVKNSSTFIARSASSCSSWESGGGTNKTIALGDYIDPDARGSYYLRTNPTSPYGLGQAGSQPAE